MKLVHLRLMAHAMSVRATVAMIAHLARTAEDTRVVQSVHHMVATIAHLVVTVLLTVTATHVLHTATAMTAVHVAETARLMVVQVQQQVAATLVK